MKKLLIVLSLAVVVAGASQNIAQACEGVSTDYTVTVRTPFGDEYDVSCTSYGIVCGDDYWDLGRQCDSPNGLAM